jgi:hypothetical protein
MALQVAGGSGILGKHGVSNIIRGFVAGGGRQQLHQVCVQRLKFAGRWMNGAGLVLCQVKNQGMKSTDGIRNSSCNAGPLLSLCFECSRESSEEALSFRIQEGVIGLRLAQQPLQRQGQGQRALNGILPNK